MQPRLLTERERALLIPLVKEWEQIMGTIGELEENLPKKPIDTEHYLWAIESLEMTEEEVEKAQNNSRKISAGPM